MGLQKQFKEFHDNIKISDSKLKQLTEKRDILLGKLKDSKDMDITFEKLDQGSYSMDLGVEPLGKEYDIDVALRFNINKDDIKPVDLKEKIYNILKNHTKEGAEIRKPCVTVYYTQDKEIAYHVDLVSYTYEDKDDKESQLHLARGKKTSPEEEKIWEKSDPKGLTDMITGKFEDKDVREQYRRVIKYLKRWKNYKFSSDGNAEPPSIGITLLAWKHFEPQEYDAVENKYVFNDFKALKLLVEDMLTEFKLVEYSSEKDRWLYKIELDLPVEPKTNVFYKMSLNYMTDFKEKLEKLKDCLDKVEKETDEVKQCELLAKQFGDDFPVPKAEAVSSKQSRSIVSTSQSA